MASRASSDRTRAPNFCLPSLAAASLVLGIASVTIGLCCYFGILTAPTALILGIVALVQIKNDPAKYGGKGLAIGGIVTSIVYFVILAVMILFWGLVSLGNLQ